MGRITEEERVKYMDLGICVSASFLCCVRDLPSVAADLLKNYNISKNRVKEIADEYDKKILLPLYESESILREERIVMSDGRFYRI